MNKKLGLLAILVIIILVAFGFFMSHSSSTKEILVGESKFVIPSEYQEQNVSNHLVKITSGDNIYFINENNNSNITYFVDFYVNHKNVTENKSVNVSHLMYGDSDIYKAVVNDNASIVHYWFLKNGKCYEIYTGTANSNTDNLILDIIKS
ncbi:hypothetical protein [uncultured Methanobrevibacter sp.]|uniref:hypothetical protein n=1 Tax=uncultured Methanobrevibacter sp. TaxID=253161 RepID=UPI0025D58ADE|nr:hypothetical protein [uncultured Methanobrevibacter sp.]